MQYHINSWAILASILVLFAACTPEAEEEEYVNEEFQYYFDRFEEAAIERGLNLDITDLTAHISIITEQNVAGVCETAQNGDRTIRVDDQFWFESDEWGREFVIFHELGHCVLGRGHTDEADVQGNCQSIMQSGLSGCNMPYGVATREAYLDELFEQ